MASWDALLGPVSRRVVEELLGGERSLTELAEATRLTKPSLLRHVNELVALGVVSPEVRRTSRGRSSFYRLQAASFHVEIRPETSTILTWAADSPMDASFPLASQVGNRKARLEVLGVLGGLRVHLGELNADLWDELFIVLFGSAARDELTWKSDLDFLFVCGPARITAAKAAVEEAFSIIQPEMDHAARAAVMSRSDFVSRKKTLAREAAEEGIVLHAPRSEVQLWKAMTRYRRFST